MQESIAFVLDLLQTLWSFVTPFGVTVGVLVLFMTGVPILIWAFKTFLGR